MCEDVIKKQLMRADRSPSDFLTPLPRINSTLGLESGFQVNRFLHGPSFPEFAFPLPFHLSVPGVRSLGLNAFSFKGLSTSVINLFLNLCL